MSENFTAGSTTGIDLAALEKIARAADQDDQHIYTNPRDSNNWAANANWQVVASPSVVLALIALARATPQHSVTEQDEPVAWRYQRDRQAYPGVPDGEWQFMAHGNQALDLQGKRLGWKPNDSHHCWEPLHTRAQPLASTAATQPEQAANVKPWREAFRYTYPNFPLKDIKPLDALTWAEKEIADLRTALTIPASTAASEQADELDHADTVLRVQEALGITTTGYVSPDVILLRIRQVQHRANSAASEQQASVSEADMLRDILAIQEACGLHTDEYAPGSVIEYIKELEGDAVSGRATIPSDGDERAPSDDWIMDEYKRIVAYPERLSSGDYATAIKLVRAALTQRATTPDQIHVSVNYPDCQYVAPVLRVFRSDGRLDILVEGRATTAADQQGGSVIGGQRWSKEAEMTASWLAAQDQQGDTASASIEEDIRFQCLLYHYLKARWNLALGKVTTDEATDAFRELIAHIDGRAQQGAAQAQAGDMARLWALHAAVAAIYFDDSSDFRSALHSVISHLDPVLSSEVLENPQAAYYKVSAAMAAPATSGGKA